MLSDPDYILYTQEHNEYLEYSSFVLGKIGGDRLRNNYNSTGFVIPTVSSDFVQPTVDEVVIVDSDMIDGVDDFDDDNMNSSWRRRYDI